jgi:hypothetical protein
MTCEDVVAQCFLDEQAPLADPELNCERTLKYLECFGRPSAVRLWRRMRQPVSGAPLDVKAKQDLPQASLGNEAGRLPGAEPLRLPLPLLKPVVPLMVNMKRKGQSAKNPCCHNSGSFVCAMELDGGFRWLEAQRRPVR